jgi:TonB family protein
MSTTALAILAGAAIKGTAVLAVTWVAALALRRRSAAARHLVWTAAAAALLALPLLATVLPALRVPIDANGPMAIFRVDAFGRSGAAAAHGGGASEEQSQTPLSDWRPWVVGLWATGSATGLLQMLWAAALLSRVRRTAHVFDDLNATLPLCDALGIDHPVAILETARGAMPMTCGVFRPTVLLPAGAREWTAERLRVVLLHELAHVRRGDVATHLLARTALSLYWWNPLAWIAWRRFVREREHATDDLVLSAGERASDYAGHLLDVARSLQAETVTAWAALAMARRSQLEGRLLAILDSHVDRRPAGRKAAAIAVLAATVAAASFAALQARDAILPDALLSMGMKAYASDNYDAAAGYFQRILTSDPNGKYAGPAMTWLAGVRRHQPGRDAEVELLYRRALTVEDPKSLDAVNTLTNYAGFLRTQQRFGEAAELDVRANRLRSFRVGHGVTAPSVLYKVEPAYSESARQAKIMGAVLLSIVVEPDGRASNIRVARSLEASLDQKAIDAVSRWKFRPGTKDGMPVPVQASIEVNFRLL